jgi:hypothetical protein
MLANQTVVDLQILSAKLLYSIYNKGEELMPGQRIIKCLFNWEVTNSEKDVV